MQTERLQKYLAAAGFGSRRACELLITDRRVAVNGKFVSDLPVLIDPQRDRVAVDGKPVAPQRFVYFLLNKPKDVLCTHSDPAGRTRAVDLLMGVRERVFPVGRLDADSTGLLLLTNDGALAQRITHPRYGVPKTYLAEVAGRVEQAALDKLREGVWLSEGRTSPARAKVAHRQRDKTVVEITLREGRNREVRRMLAKLGHNVRRLKRVAIGPLKLGSLPLGAYRALRKEELAGVRRYLNKSAARHRHATSPAVAAAPGAPVRHAFRRGSAAR